MLIKIVFITIDVLAIVTLVFMAIASSRIKRSYGWWLKYTLISGIIAITANIFIALVIPPPLHIT